VALREAADIRVMSRFARLLPRRAVSLPPAPWAAVPTRVTLIVPSSRVSRIRPIV
jgi:hypothetical protein